MNSGDSSGWVSIDQMPPEDIRQQFIVSLSPSGKAWAETHPSAFLDVAPQLLKTASLRYALPIVQPASDTVEDWLAAFEQLHLAAANSSQGRVTRQSTLTMPQKVSMEDVVTDGKQILALGTTQPNEHSMEPEVKIVLRADLDAGADKCMRLLRGEGLADEHGVGDYLARPQRILICNEEHFLMIADRPPPAWTKPEARQTRQPPCKEQCEARGAPTKPILPVSFELETPQLAVFRIDGPAEANFVCYLERPTSISANCIECDVSPASVQVEGSRVLGLVRWRDPERLEQYWRGTAGQGSFMCGWQKVEVVVWDWQSGKVEGRIPLLGVERERPQIALVSQDLLVVHFKNAVFEESAVFSLNDGGRRCSSTWESLKEAERAHDALAINCPLVSIKRSPLYGEPAAATGFVGRDLYLAAHDKPFAQKTASQDSYELVILDTLELSNLPGFWHAAIDVATTEHELLPSTKVLLTSGHRAILQTRSRSALGQIINVNAARSSSDYYLLDLLPNTEDRANLYKVAGSRSTLLDSRGRHRDSGYVSPSSDDAEKLEHGWTAVRMLKIEDARMLSALKRKGTIWQAGRIISFDATASLGKGTLEVLDF